MPVTQTGRNVESLITDLSGVRKQLGELPGALQTTINGLLAAIQAELTEHRDQFIGVLRAEQNEAARFRKDNAAQQRRIEELLAELGQVRLDLVRAGLPDLASPGQQSDPEAEAEADAAALLSGDRQEPAPTRDGIKDNPLGPVPTPTTISPEEPAVTDSIPQTGADDVPPAVRDFVRQVLAEQLRASTPQDAVVEASPDPDPDPAPSPAVAAPLRLPAGGTNDLIPPALAWLAHVATLRKAAAINTLAVACNPHTWDFLADQVHTTGGNGAASHFTDPAGTERDQRRDWERASADPAKQPDTVLSGRSTVALLNALHATVHRGLDAELSIETWALAVTAYERIAEVVNATRPEPTAGTQNGPDDRPRVELDDRSPGQTD